MVYSSDQSIIERIRWAGNFGFSANRDTTLLGLNSKISEYTAAIALATLDVYAEKKKKREQLDQWYRKFFDEFGLNEKGWVTHKSIGSIASQFFSLLCQEEQDNQAIISRLATYKIEARSYFSPACHQQKMFVRYPSTILKVTDNISRRIVSLPLWEEMNEFEVKYIMETINRL